MDVSLGAFNPGATAKALESCADCPPATDNQYKGVPYYSWSEAGNSNLAFAPPSFDNLGRGGHIAVTDRFALRAQTNNDMRLLVDTIQDKHRSLADLKEFQLVASGMAQLKSYTMFLSSLTFSLDEYTVENGQKPSKRQAEKWSQPVLLRPYLAYGTGAGIDAEGPYMALVLVHGNSGNAEENVTLLRRRINEGVSIVYEEPWAEQIDEVSITANGPILSAMLRGKIAKSPMLWAITNENLILHE